MMGPNKFDGRIVGIGYRTPRSAPVPKFGELLRLPDGSGPWRVVDWLNTNLSPVGNVLVVEFAGN
jgi:hypothetical protein